MRIGDWSSDVCSSDLPITPPQVRCRFVRLAATVQHVAEPVLGVRLRVAVSTRRGIRQDGAPPAPGFSEIAPEVEHVAMTEAAQEHRSEERRVRKRGDRTWRSQGAADHEKKKKT